jgi:hypothetical protein
MSIKAQVSATKLRDGLFSLPAEGKLTGNAQTPSQSLTNALMRSSLVKVHVIRFEKAVKLLLLEDQEVIQAFAPRTTQKASRIVWYVCILTSAAEGHVILQEDCDEAAVLF